MRIIMLRHGESIGNIDESAFCRVPDHSMALTPRGEQQCRAAGEQLRDLLGDTRIEAYVSPYVRTLQTLDLLGLEDNLIGVRQEPRLREQDWGNLQDETEQATQKAERNTFGHFFYRLQSGESGADVYDRVTAFLGSVLSGRPAGFRLTDPSAREPDPLPGNRTLLFVTHGLTMRLACMSLMGWTVAEFERLSNPENGEFRVLTRDPVGQWSLDRPFERWC